MPDLTSLPLTFLEHLVRANPRTQVFSNGATRREIETELWRRRIVVPSAPEVVSVLPLPSKVEEVRRLTTFDFCPADEATCALITVLITASLVPSHPATWLLMKTYESIRRQLPDARIVVLNDGLDRAEPWEYQEYKATLAKDGVETINFRGYHNQNLMLKAALNLVETSLVLVGEHDWCFKPRGIQWPELAAALVDLTAPARSIQVRQAEIADWEQPFFGQVYEAHGVHLLPTTCFQAPYHLANVQWYRDVAKFFNAPQKLEHDGKAYQQAGALDRLAFYLPPGPYSGRLAHLNGHDVDNPRQVESLGND